jgi:hypothetical protein
MLTRAVTEDDRRRLALSPEGASARRRPLRDEWRRSGDLRHP